MKFDDLIQIPFDGTTRPDPKVVEAARAEVKKIIKKLREQPEDDQ